MPRPKKAGGPEPKKRSRNGCWPCKSRKVKCDEAKPGCQNCEKHGEVCDYSVRLNWDGRGKQKADTANGSGKINFSAGMITMARGTPSREVTTTSTNSTASQTEIRIAVQTQAPPVLADRTIPLQDAKAAPRNHHSSSTATTQAGGSRYLMIDPALTSTDNISPAILMQEALHRQNQYTQSYEQYQSGLSRSPSSVPLQLISRLRHNHGSEDSASSPESFDNSPRPIKRMRFQREHTSHDLSMPPPNSMPYLSNSDFLTSLDGVVPRVAAATSLTPASSEGGYRSHSTKSPNEVQESPDLRRLSVSSLLSGPPGLPYQNNRSQASRSNSEVQDGSVGYQDVWQDTMTWGVDRGFKDLDIGKNDDVHAISGSSPAVIRDHLELVLDRDGDLTPIEFGFGMDVGSRAFESGGYYDKPVSISIPRALEPLPSKLLENPMNLLYFHHFLNHTAGCLIPHNCSSNPFKSILPQMAVHNEDLMNLLLAYSASHRARLLRQPEPATRIALWVTDIFPNLRRALDDPGEIISNASLATAIMLASLEIISPKAFGVAVPWQKHLDTARRMIAARGGPQRMQTASRGDKASSFLWSWFAYLDVLGSLSGGKTSSGSAWILDYEIDDENDYQIDCILGFTSRCIQVLAKIAELARKCDSQRLVSPRNTPREPWQPSEVTLSLARKLEQDLAESRLHPSKPCTHMQSQGESSYAWDSIEISATNEAFHWAGLVHLHRRILGKPSAHAEVQGAVREIFGALYKVRRGSSAEACLLFPMFTAGCDTQTEGQRSDILGRLKAVERFGMTQVHKARTLMERVWETGKPWETLVTGEFFG